MDQDLQRYLNGLFILLILNMAVNLDLPAEDMLVDLFVAGVFGGAVYVFVVNPGLLRAN